MRPPPKHGPTALVTILAMSLVVGAPAYAGTAKTDPQGNVTACRGIDLTNTINDDCDEWTATVRLPAPAGGVQVLKGKKITIDFPFRGAKGLEIKDTGIINNDEGIFFDVRALANAGVGFSGSYALEYEWHFLGPFAGALQSSNPITGTGNLMATNGRAVIDPSGDSDAKRSVNITRKRFVFCGLRLVLTVPANIDTDFWIPDKVTLKICADSIKVVKCPKGKTEEADSDRGKNFHTLSNGADLTSTGLGAGGSQVAGVDGLGFWIGGEDMRGSAFTGNGDFGYRQTGFRFGVCVPSGNRVVLPAIVVTELTGRNANAPDVFLRPPCTSAGLVGVGSSGVIPYGAPPGSSVSFIATGAPSGLEGVSTGTPFLVPNNGLIPSSSGGKACIIAAGSCAIPFGSSGGCFIVQFEWGPSALASEKDVDGWWTWLTSSPDGNQYWAMSNDELNVFQSQSVATTGGMSAVVAFTANLDFACHSLTASPATNDALLPAGFNGSGPYYTNPAGGANGGFDLGRHLGFSVGGLGGVTNPITGLGNQDPGGAAIGGLTPTLGFVTWNNKGYGSGTPGVTNVHRLLWLEFDWDAMLGIDPSAAFDATLLFGTVRVPVPIPSSAPVPWPQPLTTAFFPFYVHATVDETGNTDWPDPDGFAGGTLGVPPIVGSSIHIPFTGFPGCIGIPVVFSYGSSGMLGAGGPLTWQPDVNGASDGRMLHVLD